MGVGTYADVVRRLSRGCASTAWTAGHLIEHTWMLARWPQRVQDEVFAGGPAPLAAATGAPLGTARKVPDGFSISGHWSFASGVMHSEWALLAVHCDDVRLQCLVPVAGLDLLDVWHTVGLRGTGSNDLRAENLFVPEYRAMDWALLSSADNPGSLIHADPLIHTPMATLLNLVAPSAALGAAGYAVDVFREGLMLRKVKNTRTTARLIPRYRIALALSGEASEDAVRLVMSGSGGSAHRISHPLQRIQRDVSVLLNHPTLSIDPILEQAGRGLLGLGVTVSAFQAPVPSPACPEDGPGPEASGQLPSSSGVGSSDSGFLPEFFSSWCLCASAIRSISSFSTFAG